MPDNITYVPQTQASFADWSARGFMDHLISVIPPGARMSASSKIDVKQVGKIPGRQRFDGCWSGWDWLQHVTTNGDIRRWDESGANIGLRTGRVVVVDGDVMTPELADIIKEMTALHLGSSYQRIGRAPKFALFYRLDERHPPLSRRRLWFEMDGVDKQLLEVLGHGQQVVVGGLHPATRQPYSWDRLPTFDGLTSITPEKLERFLSAVQAAAERAGYVCRTEGALKEVADRAHIPQESLLAPSDGAVRELVALMPNTTDLFPDRRSWIYMGMAIKASCRDDATAREVWLDWSEKWEHFSGFEDVASNFERFKPPFAIGWDYVQDEARRCGVPTAHYEFSEENRGLVGYTAHDSLRHRRFPRIVTFPGMDLNAIPRRPWVLGTRFMAETITAGFGAPGTGKSAMAMLSALAIATGRNLTGEEVHRSGPVMIYNAEDDQDELHRRLAGLLHHYGLTESDLAGRLFLVSGSEMKLMLASKDQNGVTPVSWMVDELVEGIVRRDVVHLVLDPFVSMHNAAENNNEEMEGVASILRTVASRTGVSIDLIHHNVKQHDGKPESRAGDMNAGRGASAITGAVRAAYTLMPMGKDTQKTMDIPVELASRLVRLDMAKANYAPRGTETYWFELRSTNVGNYESSAEGELSGDGDQVGVPVRWTPPTALPETMQERLDAQNRQHDQVAHALARAMAGETAMLTDVLPGVQSAFKFAKSKSRELILAAIPVGSDGRIVYIDGVPTQITLSRMGVSQNSPLQVRKMVVPSVRD